MSDLKSQKSIWSSRQATGSEKKGKDAWDKWDVILKPIGGLLTAISVALVGFFGTQYLNRQQATETNIRLYAELMSNREKADSDLRKEMVNSIIKTFLEQAGNSQNNTQTASEDEILREIEQNTLALELVAYNFHDVIDIGPLFKHVEARIMVAPEGEHRRLRERLEKVAREVNEKQMATLEDAGVVKSMHIFFEDLRAKPGGIRMLDYEPLELPPGFSIKEPRRLFTVEVLDDDPVKRELRVRMEIYLEEKDVVEADFTFRVGFFDFPMIDNTRLSNGQRVALVLRRWLDTHAEIGLVYFPGSRASLKEKPYYDEVIEELIRTRDRLDQARTGS